MSDLTLYIKEGVRDLTVLETPARLQENVLEDSWAYNKQSRMRNTAPMKLIQCRLPNEQTS